MCDTRHTGREGFTLLYRVVLQENITSIRKGYGATYFSILIQSNNFYCSAKTGVYSNFKSYAAYSLHRRALDVI